MNWDDGTRLPQWTEFWEMGEIVAGELPHTK